MMMMKMSAKINWHRYGTKLRHCYPTFGLLPACTPCSMKNKLYGRKHYFTLRQSGLQLAYLKGLLNELFLFNCYVIKKL